MVRNFAWAFEFKRSLRAEFAPKFLAVAVLGLTTIGASATSLRVRDARFVENPDGMVIDMVNDGMKTDAGFYLDVTVTLDGKVLRRFGYKCDLLGPMMFDWISKGKKVYSRASAIPPQGLHEEFLPEDIGGAGPTRSNVDVEIKATVDAVLYVDGSIEGSGEAELEMRQLFEATEAVIQADGELNSIFQAHAKDPNTRERLRAILAEVDALPEPPESMRMYFVEARGNLHNMLSAPPATAKIEIDGYTAHVARRHALMVAAVNGQTSERPN